MASSGIGAVLHTVANNSDPDGMLWRMIVETNCMSKVLSSPPPPEKLLSEVVTAYNGVGTYAQRIQVLSLIATKYSFGDLKKFNSHSATSSEVGEIAANKDTDADDADDDNDWPGGFRIHCFFNPPLSYHIYRQARLHYHNNGHGLSPVVRARSYQCCALPI